MPRTKKETVETQETVSKETPVETLNRVVPLFGHVKTEADAYKKIADGYAATIKDTMIETKLESFVAADFEVTCTPSEKSSFDTDKLIAIIKGSDIPKSVIKKIIKKAEYVDMHELENALYNGKIEPIILEPAQQTSVSYTLRLKKKKADKKTSVKE